MPKVDYAEVSVRGYGLPMMAGLITMLLVSSSVVVPNAAASQLETFTIRIMKVLRVDEGCTVDAESDAVRFTLRSSLAAPCAMVRAGETYKASRVTAQNDQKDETKDTTMLVIENNVKNARRSNSVFDIESEEVIKRK